MSFISRVSPAAVRTSVPVASAALKEQRYLLKQFAEEDNPGELGNLIAHTREFLRLRRSADLTLMQKAELWGAIGTTHVSIADDSRPPAPLPQAGQDILESLESDNPGEFSNGVARAVRWLNTAEAKKLSVSTLAPLLVSLAHAVADLNAHAS